MFNKVSIEAGIIEITVVGDQTIETIRSIEQPLILLIEQQRKANQPVLLLDDVVGLKTADPEARQKVVDLAKTLHYDKLAMVGKGGIIRVGANLLLQIIGRGDKTKYFDDRAQAIAWLHQN